MDTVEMLKMFETARKMADMLNPSDAEDTNEPERENEPKQAELTQVFDYGDIESRVQTPELMTIKAAIPFLERKYQKDVSVFIKLIEIRRLMELYRDTAVTVQGGPAGEWRKDMLVSVRPFVEEKKRARIDMLIKCLELNEIFQKMMVE